MLNCAHCTQIMVSLDLNKDMSKGMQTKKPVKNETIML